VSQNISDVVPAEGKALRLSDVMEMIGSSDTACVAEIVIGILSADEWRECEYTYLLLVHVCDVNRHEYMCVRSPASYRMESEGLS
jgi:hypothetical protein